MKKSPGNIVNRGLQNLNVIQSNVIARSAQGLSLIEKRILMSALAQSKGIGSSVRISAHEYAETFEIDNIDNVYRDLSSASRSFMKRSFTLPTITEKGNSSEISYNWLSHVHYAKTEGFVEIHFNPNIYFLLFNLTEKFTKYQLKQATALRSLYSWRLLELFESVRKSTITEIDGLGNSLATKKQNSGWLKISIDDFNHSMGTPKSYKNNFKDLNRRLIQPAIHELEQKDGWKIDYKPIKKGRKVEMLEFNFYRDPQGRLF